jgi:hypothetical protein
MANWGLLDPVGREDQEGKVGWGGGEGDGTCDGLGAEGVVVVVVVSSLIVFSKLIKSSAVICNFESTKRSTCLVIFSLFRLMERWGGGRKVRRGPRKDWRKLTFQIFELIFATTLLLIDFWLLEFLHVFLFLLKIVSFDLTLCSSLILDYYVDKIRVLNLFFLEQMTLLKMITLKALSSLKSWEDFWVLDLLDQLILGVL